MGQMRMRRTKKKIKRGNERKEEEKKEEGVDSPLIGFCQIVYKS